MSSKELRELESKRDRIETALDAAWSESLAKQLDEVCAAIDAQEAQ